VFLVTVVIVVFLSVVFGRFLYKLGYQVMVILTDYDKENISQMIKKAHKYAQFPSNMTEEEMKKFMGIKRKNL
jgi:hypothetical protein